MSDLKELSNFDIEDILSKKNIRIHGVYSKDQLPKITNGFYVVNLQNHDEGNGTHWTCFLKKGDKVFYMDSFGSPAPIEVEKRIGEYYFNDKQIQNLNSEACGYYCIAFIQYMDKIDNPTKRDFEKFTDIFKTNSTHNDVILKNIVKVGF